jgi:hypothetical protein
MDFSGPWSLHDVRQFDAMKSIGYLSMIIDTTTENSYNINFGN